MNYASMNSRKRGGLMNHDSWIVRTEWKANMVLCLTVTVEPKFFVTSTSYFRSTLLVALNPLEVTDMRFSLLHSDTNSFQFDHLPFFPLLQAILGKVVRRPAHFDPSLVNQLVSLGQSSFSDFKTYAGTTMCTSDFYEGQGRLDGAFCDYTKDDKIRWLHELKLADVKNIEMESIIFGAMCTSAGIKGGIICVTLLDRLKGDQVLLSPVEYEEFQMRPQKLAGAFIKMTLNQSWCSILINRIISIIIYDLLVRSKLSDTNTTWGIIIIHKTDVRWDMILHILME